MKTKFAFMLLGLFLLLNISTFCGDLKWIGSAGLVYYGDGFKLSNDRNYCLLADKEDVRVYNSKKDSLISVIQTSFYPLKDKGNYVQYDFSSNNDFIFIILEKQVQIWDFKRAELVKEYDLTENETEYFFLGVVKPKNQDYFVGLASSKNEPNSYKIITWDVDSFKIKNSFVIDIENLMLHSLEISPDGSFLSVRLKDSVSWNLKYSTTNKIYNLNNNTVIKEINQNIYTAMFTNDYFAYFNESGYQGNENKIVICDLNEFNVAQEISCSKSEYKYSNQFDISDDGKYLLFIDSIFYHNALIIYNLESKKTEYSINPKNTKLDNFRFINKDTILIAILAGFSYTNPIAEIIDCKTNSFITQIFNGITYNLKDICFTNDNKYVCAINGYITMYEVETGKMVLSKENDFLITSGPVSIEMNKNNTKVVWAGTTGSVAIIDILQPDSTLYCTKVDASFISASLSADDKTLLSASYVEGLIILWDLENRTVKDTLKIDERILLTFFSEDEDFVYAVAIKEGWDNAILYKWNQVTDELTSKTLYGFNPYFLSPCKVSSDKRYLSCPNAVYDIENDVVHSISIDAPLSANSVASNSHFIAVSAGIGIELDDGVLFRVIDWTDNEVINEYKLLDYISCSDRIKNFFQFSYAVRFSPNNQYIAASTEYGDIALFKFDTTSSAVEEYKETNTYEAKVFPNPASNLVNLDLSLPVSGVVNVTIRDVQGVAVIENYSEFFASGKANVPFNLPKLASGMYYLTVSFNTETTTIPLIIIN